MTEEMRNMEELAPVRLPTAVLSQIEQLADERRRLLGKLTRFDDGRTARNRLGEIDKQLTRLWEVRRHELR
ncbi:MAG: hypothetical protein WBW04_13265 [Nitrolancea sp.]